ncbi:hypothetical protein M0R45_029160 [Rubus argutus]|uniref:Uncharacterized protein n=1 Tax=Rubus argutus TaxID=59490 RepID=A0AAW1WBC4_RUBAR
MTWPENSPAYKVSADTSQFKYSCWYGSRSAIRIARIVKESFELGLENIRWFVMGDDDTVFFTDNLVTVLAKYNHNEMYYIGGNSESVEQDVLHSYSMAYGGGGFALSYPLAAELVRVLDGCIDRYDKFYGSDQKVQGCLSEIGVPVTKELGFHQMDIRGSPLWFASGHPVAPLVSLHHFDYMEPMFPNLTRIDSVRKLVVSVSWGYTVQLYPSLVTAKMLDTALETFHTWKSWKLGPYTFNTRSVSPDPCKRPLVYFLDRVESVDGDETLTVYKRYVEKGEKDCPQRDYIPALEVQFFNVSASSFNPNLWNKAPRRQCCEIVNGGEVKSVAQIKVRGCNRFEHATPVKKVETL